MNPKTHIRVRCTCGAVLMAPLQLAGRHASCGSCGGDVVIPEPVQKTRRVPLETDTELRVTGAAPTFRPAGSHEDRNDLSQSELRERRKRRRQAGSRAAESGTPRRQTGWWRSSLLFPFRVESLITIGVLSTLYSVLLSSYLPLSLGWMLFLRSGVGAILSALIVGYFIYFSLGVLRTAAGGQDDLPLVSEWNQEYVLTDLFLALGTLALCLLPWGIYQTHCFLESREPDALANMVLLTIPGFYFPMAMLSVTIHHSFVAINPVTVIRAMLVTWIDYLVVLLLILLGFVAGWGVMQIVPGGFLQQFLWWWITFTAATMSAHALGSLYRENRVRLAWLDV